MLHGTRVMWMFAFAGCLTLSGLAPMQDAPSQPPAASQPKPGPKPGPTPAQAGDAKLDRMAEIIASAMDKAHGGERLRTHAILQCDLALKAGEIAMTGKLAVQINGQAARLDMSDGSSIVFDGSECWVAPASNPIPAGAAASRVRAWRNLLLAPFMARDRSVRVAAFRAAMVMGADVDGFQVHWQFGEHAPAQSLIGYADARSHQLSIVAGEALAGLLGLPVGEQSVRSVVFTDPESVEGSVLPTTWWLYDWTEAAGVRGERLGTVAVSNLRLLKSDAVEFTAPGGGRKDAEAPKP